MEEFEEIRELCKFLGFEVEFDNLTEKEAMELKGKVIEAIEIFFN